MTHEEGSPARSFLGILAIDGIALGGVAWTQKGKVLLYWRGKIAEVP
jgi:hypothetical protein